MPAYIAGSVLLLSLLIYAWQRYKSSITNTSHTAADKKTSLSFAIRRADTTDIEIIRNLALEIWPRTYSQLVSPQQVIYMLNQLFSEASLLKQMRDQHQFTLIYAGSLPIGFTSCSEVHPYVFKLHKIYILPAYQGLGAGKYIMQCIINEVRSNKASSLILNITQNNPAKAFYEQLGFKIVKAECTEVGNGYTINDYVMELDLHNTTAKPKKAKALQKIV